jgi:hypothetical protein
MNYKRLTTGGNQMSYDNNGKDNIYYNIRIDNEIDGVDNSATNDCTYDKQTQSILDKQSDYKLAVKSWSIRARVPVFLVTIQQGTNTDINLTPFRVNFSYTTGGVNTNYPSTLVWVPDFAFNALNPLRTTPLPKSPNENNGIQDLVTSPQYYYCNSYQKWIDIMNSALLSSYTAFNAVHAGIHASAPHIQYDNRTGLFSIIAELSYAVGAGGIGTNKAFVSFDALLYKYIDSIPAEFNGFNQPNGADYTIAFQQKLGGSNAWALGNHYAGRVVNPQTSPPSHIIMEQENDCRFLWSNIKQILIVSDSLNVRSEFMPSINFPQQLNQQSVIPNPDRIVGGTSIIGDINRFNLDKKSVISYIDYNYASPNVDTRGPGSSVHRDIFYEPKYEKYIDLVGDGPLNNIAIEIFFQTEDGFYLPLNIPNKSNVNVKLHFKRKFF